MASKVQPFQLLPYLVREYGLQGTTFLVSLFFGLESMASKVQPFWRLFYFILVVEDGLKGNYLSSVSVILVGDGLQGTTFSAFPLFG